MKISPLIRKIQFKNIICLTLAGIVNACGVTLFLAPVNLYDSGISGTSILLSQITPPEWTLSLFLLLLNIPLFLYGLKKQGVTFTVSAIYTVAVYSITAYIITDILPIDVATSSPLAEKDLLLCAIFGGFISGIGSGIAIRYGGAMDGIEVMAVIFSKKLGLTVGEFVMIYNAILYVSAGFIMKSWVIPLYSILTYVIGLKAVDFIVEGLDRSKAAMIITVKPEDVSAELSHMFESGATIIDATGGYSNSPKAVVYFVVNRFQIRKMQQLVHEVDPAAYITISDVADIYKANNR